MHWCLRCSLPSLALSLAHDHALSVLLSLGSSVPPIQAIRLDWRGWRRCSARSRRRWRLDRLFLRRGSRDDFERVQARRLLLDRVDRETTDRLGGHDTSAEATARVVALHLGREVRQRFITHVVDILDKVQASKSTNKQTSKLQDANKQSTNKQVMQEHVVPRSMGGRARSAP